MSKCDNSNFLFEKLFLAEATSDVCPTDVTLDMLKHELICGDLQANVELMKDLKFCKLTKQIFEVFIQLKIFIIN